VWSDELESSITIISCGRLVEFRAENVDLFWEELLNGLVASSRGRGFGDKGASLSDELELSTKSDFLVTSRRFRLFDTKGASSGELESSTKSDFLVTSRRLRLRGTKGASSDELESSTKSISSR
jgi:hypothetical protein